MRKTVIALASAAVLAGCASHAQVNAGGGGLNVQTSTHRGALLAIGILAIAAGGASEQDGTRYRANPLLALEPAIPAAAPPMDARRKVNEQDCTRPIEDFSPNLKCR